MSKFRSKGSSQTKIVLRHSKAMGGHERRQNIMRESGEDVKKPPWRNIWRRTFRQTPIQGGLPLHRYETSCNDATILTMDVQAELSELRRKFIQFIINDRFQIGIRIRGGFGVGIEPPIRGVRIRVVAGR
jgi:hypothetical protein